MDTIECKHDISSCAFVERIKNLLNKFNAIIEDSTENKIDDALLQLINDTFIKNDYSRTQLINDFHHIKYDHYADSDDYKFAAIYNYITSNTSNICQFKRCHHVQRHYRGRSKLINQYNLQHDDGYSIELISRIHVYFIHSYDINRLTLKEKKSIDEQLNLLKQ
eukprot:273015_1